MMPELVARMRSTIERHRMLRAGDRVAIAVSGGADSVALLRLFEELRADLGLTLCVAHFNHQLRGRDSDADEKFVELLARRKGIDFLVGREDVTAAAKRHKWNLEDAARRRRYAFFARLVESGKATRVATAHTADDQAETVLARLIRGTGLTGLAAIYPVHGGVIRPLLDVQRKELRAYLTDAQQEWREDESNADTRRMRSRVRTRLLPLLEEDFSGAVVGTLGGLAALARDDERFWEVLVQERCNCMVKRADGESTIRAKDLLWPIGDASVADPKESDEVNPYRALTQRIIRRLYAEISRQKGELSRRHVEQVIRLAATGTSGGELELPGGTRVRREFDCLIFGGGLTAGATKTRAVPKKGYSYGLILPAHGSADITIAELGKRFRLKVIDWPMGARETTFGGAVLDAERLRPPLVFRNWRPGDAYRPSGRRQQRKVSRMLIAARIAGARRFLWPILTSQGRIAWADRMPPAEEFSASEATRTALWITEDAG